MNEIIVGKDTVTMTITYSESYSNEHEMIEAVKAAAELRGLVAKPDSIDELDEEIERQLRAKDVADRLRGYGGMADAPA